MTILWHSSVTIRNWKSAPPDPGIMPGGIRDQALQGALARGQQPEDKEKTKASQEYWAKHRAAPQSLHPSEIDQRPTIADSEVAGMPEVVRE